MKKRKALSIIELLVAITIMAVIASSLALAPQTGKQTAKREAERIAAYLIGLTHEFGRNRQNFELDLANSNLPRGRAFSVSSGGFHGMSRRDFYLRDGCTFEPDFGLNHTIITYHADKNTFDDNGHITITDFKGDMHKVVIYTQGRVKTEQVK